MSANPLPESAVLTLVQASNIELRAENTSLKIKLRESSALMVEAQGQFKRDSDTIARLEKELRFEKALVTGYQMTVRELIQLANGADQPTLPAPPIPNN